MAAGRPTPLHKVVLRDVDRVYLTLSVPTLVVGGQVVSFPTAQEKNPIPSPTLLERRGQAFRRAVASYAGRCAQARTYSARVAVSRWSRTIRARPGSGPSAPRNSSIRVRNSGVTAG
jgi:hypothetical protein